jgi:hypothetical protein
VRESALIDALASQTFDWPVAEQAAPLGEKNCKTLNPKKPKILKTLNPITLNPTPRSKNPKTLNHITSNVKTLNPENPNLQTPTPLKP